MLVKQKRGGWTLDVQPGRVECGRTDRAALSGRGASAFILLRGQILEGMGLNITMWSYVNQMNFSLLACKEAIPDLWDLTEDIREAFEELRKMAANRVGRAA